MSVTYEWPPRMIMKIACAYTGRTRWTLARAARAGSLPIAGRNGRTLVFDRAALDSWLVGEGFFEAIASPDRRRALPASVDALARLRDIVRGES